ncbi:hypothetical protein [Paenibacillus elgii]|uniref:Uncharacterized protein n=1 Tax=Paenibacillus elgii TaxID=189691 RepID=A0A163W560_9BACL|nr:hypothetical protein [Paenibacillus elgii]KZE75870.1 hypothetical protein AV654_25755 [Paenibacillus elgii]NEN86389.1 hypothetical protein [Paenibacillus elgii]
MMCSLTLNISVLSDLLLFPNHASRSVTSIALLKLKEVTKLQYQTMLDEMKEKDDYSQSSINLAHVACKETDITKDAELPVFHRTVKQLESEDDCQNI